MSLRSSFLMGIVVGVCAGILVCGMALDHNPQGEFADYETGAYTADLYRLFAVRAMVVGVPIAAFLALCGLGRDPSD